MNIDDKLYRSTCNSLITFVVKGIHIIHTSEFLDVEHQNNGLCQSYSRMLLKKEGNFYQFVAVLNATAEYFAWSKQPFFATKLAAIYNNYTNNIDRLQASTKSHAIQGDLLAKEREELEIRYKKALQEEQSNEKN